MHSQTISSHVIPATVMPAAACPLLASGCYSLLSHPAACCGAAELRLRCSNWKIASDLICISGPDKLGAKVEEASLVKFLGTMGQLQCAC